MVFVGKIAKTTENSEIKYKSLKYSDLYFIFRRFSILLIDLITVHEVLPDDVGRGGNRGDGIQERLRHPYGQHGVLLPEGLSSGGRIAVAAAQHAPDLELHQTDHQRREGQPQLRRKRSVVQVDDEAGRAADDHQQRHQPHVERNLAVVADPFRQLREDEAAELRRGEGPDEQRGDPCEDLREGALARPGEGEDHGSDQRNGHVAHQTVCGHRGDVGTQHAADDHRSHRHGRQHTDHGTLRHDVVQRPQQQVDRDADHDLKRQQPDVQHRGFHLFGADAAEGDEEHQEDQRRRDHLMAGGFEGRNRSAQQRPHHHGRRHGDGPYVAVQLFEQMHFMRGVP